MLSNVGEAARDVRSLTLPDWRTALKKRFRRPRRPSADELAALVAMVGWLCVALHDAVVGRYVAAGVTALVGGLYWGGYHRIRARGRFNNVYTAAALALAAVAIAEF